MSSLAMANHESNHDHYLTFLLHQVFMKYEFDEQWKDERGFKTQT